MGSKDINSVLLTLLTFIEYPFCNIIVKAVPRNLISHYRGCLAFSVISSIFVCKYLKMWPVRFLILIFLN